MEMPLNKQFPISAKIRDSKTTRFAPAPTGFLHLGHALNAIFVFGIARAIGANIILRFEDHDTRRSRRKYEYSIRKDLEWLGFTGDEVYWFRQSERNSYYEEIAERLRHENLVYNCDCSRRQITERTGGTKPGAELRYDGHCRVIREKELEENLGLRVILPESNISFVDLSLGERWGAPFSESGDLLIRDRHGNWTYNFAVSVDDYLQQVDLVIRGLDILHATPRQILLSSMFGRENPPSYIHHPLLYESDGTKLSKRDGAYSIAAMRSDGLTPGEILGKAMHMAGFIPENKSMQADEIISFFNKSIYSDETAP